jgi:acetyl-CoA carboxylase carboxyl transferase subunit alpha
MTVLSHEKPIIELEETILKLKDQNKGNALLSTSDLLKMERKLKDLQRSVYAKLKPWERITICRHPQRPKAVDYIEEITDEFVELFGDRAFQDDHAIIAGLAKIGGEKFVLIAQEKGKDTESRLHRNFGMPHPEGYRKALRCMELAEKFHLPVVTLLDTPGAYPGLTAEERGQGWAIAKNLLEMARLKTQIFVILIGEGCSGGALALGIGDVVAMLEHSYYSVISPEGCASILWKDASKSATAAAALKMHAEDLLELGIIDAIIPEPLGGAHHNRQETMESVKTFLLAEWEKKRGVPLSELLENRYQKFRKMGKFESILNE